MNWMLWLKSGLKYFLVTLGGTVIAALTVAITHFSPDGAVQEVLGKYIVIPAIAGIIGLIQNFLKHNSGK